MAAPTENTFDDWLSEKLPNINPEVDLEVFVSYIRGILETDTSREDQVESISGILGEITESDLDGHCEEIVKKWDTLEGNNQQVPDKQSLEDRMHQIIETQQTQVVKSAKNKVQSAEERARKAAILAQYGQECDGTISDPEDDLSTGNGDPSGLAPNINAMAIDQAQKELRDRMKAENDKKKQKDKEDREKQKQKVQDRKESEKKRTQKGERRVR